MRRLQEEVANILSGRAKAGAPPPLWDGHAADRIAETVQKWWSAKGH